MPYRLRSSSSDRSVKRIEAVVIGALLLAACAGPANDPGDSPAIDAAAFQDYEECMAAGGFPREVRGPELIGVIPSDSIYADPAFQAVEARCLVQSGIGEVEGDTPEEVAAQNERATKLTGCLRDRGWDIDDPELVDNPAGEDYFVPRVEPPPGGAETQQAFSRDLTACATEAGIFVEGAE